MWAGCGCGVQRLLCISCWGWPWWKRAAGWCRQRWCRCAQCCGAGGEATFQLTGLRGFTHLTLHFRLSCGVGCTDTQPAIAPPSAMGDVEPVVKHAVLACPPVFRWGSVTPVWLGAACCTTAARCCSRASTATSLMTSKVSGVALMVSAVGEGRGAAACGALQSSRGFSDESSCFQAVMYVQPVVRYLCLFKLLCNA